MDNVVEMNKMNEDSMVETIDYNALNVIEREIPYDKIVDYIEFVKNNSYDKNGNYHEYLMDYTEAVTILTMYTDCDNFDFKFDDVMKFIQSEKWAKMKEELGDAYINFHYYVKKEIEYVNTPLRFADKAMKKIADSMEKINEILNAIDIGALKGYDFSKIINAIDAVGAAKTGEQVKEQVKE